MECSLIVWDWKHAQSSKTKNSLAYVGGSSEVRLTLVSARDCSRLGLQTLLFSLGLGLSLLPEGSRPSHPTPCCSFGIMASGRENFYPISWKWKESSTSFLEPQGWGMLITWDVTFPLAYRVRNLTDLCIMRWPLPLALSRGILGDHHPIFLLVPRENCYWSRAAQPRQPVGF